ncbi:MAG: ABC transporter ATP-binding protein [Caldilineaceae bacterium]|nr:ABC transporter ATP-binding protein [Caldilineaceae bacterium]
MKSPANEAISFNVEQGGIFGLLGDNGAGKSTLVKQMANLLRPTSGVVRLYGRPVQEDPFLVPRHVGYMPQTARTLNSLTVSEALYFTSHLRGCGRREAVRERDRLLQLWDLADIRSELCSRLSGGQQRLLQLAAAMAGQPPILILDEPTNELAPQRRRHVWETLRTENRERGTTIIFITHDAIEAEKTVQQVGIMHKGRLVALGKPSDLKKELNQQLRLTLRFQPDSPPDLPAGLRPQKLAEDHWLVLLDKDKVEATLSALDLSRIDDFQLHSATLEDLYLHYT